MIELTLQEREFLLQLLNSSPIRGLDVMQMSLVLARKLQAQAQPQSEDSNEKMTEHGKAILRSEAESAKRSTLASDITDAGDTAEADLE